MHCKNPANQKITRSFLFRYFSVLFLIGLAISSLIKINLFYLFIVVLVVLLITFLWSNKKYHPYALGVVFIFLSALIILFTNNLSAPNHLSHYTNNNFNLSGRVMAEPETGPKSIKIVLDQLQIYQPQNIQKIAGYLVIYLPKYNNYNIHYNDYLKFSGELQKPSASGGEGTDQKKILSYERYLAGQNIYAICFEPANIKLITNPSLSWWSIIKTNLIKIKNSGQKIIQENLPSPAAELLNGMILNYRREIPESLNQDFSRAGLSHIIAISGLNITIIAGFLWYIFSWFALSRRKTFIFGLLTLTLYVLMIGAPAPAVRALFMGALFMYGQTIGRPTHAINALLLAANIMLIINPRLLIFDLSFQLSFLAMLGMIILYPVLNKKLTFIPEKFNLRALFSLTLSAQIFTWPLIGYHFGYISLIAIISNFFVLPVLPLLTALSMFMIIVGLIYDPLAIPLALILTILTNYIIFIVHLASSLPFAIWTIN